MFALGTWVAGHLPEPACKVPIVSPPEGWLLIPGEVVDSLPGAYHDAVSGAYVVFDGHRRGAFGAETPPTSPAGAHEGYVAGVPYTSEVISNVREYLIARWTREYGEEPGSEVDQESIPLEGADRLRVAFHGRTAQWSFTSDIYSTEQDQRVRQLLFDPVSGQCLGPPDYSAGAQRKGLSEAMYLLVKDGDSAASVLEHLGPPQLDGPSGRTGLLLSYVFERPDWWYWAHLYFDRQQRLIRREEKIAP
jgi:hypothetical protein